MFKPMPYTRSGLEDRVALINELIPVPVSVQLFYKNIPWLTGYYMFDQDGGTGQNVGRTVREACRFFDQWLQDFEEDDSDNDYYQGD